MDKIRRNLILFLSIITFITCNVGSFIPTLTVKAEEDTIVVFEDENLEKAIADCLGKPAGSLTSFDLLNISEIYMDLSQEISSLEGIQYCKNLTNLEVNVKSSDLSQLSNLTNLNNLVLFDNNISNLSFLKNLNNIIYLTLEANSLTNADDLQYLIHASSIGITSSTISSLQSIHAIEGLESLYIDCKNLNSLAGFESLKKLNSLSIINSNIDDFSILNSLNNIIYADLSNNQKHLNALNYLSNLQDLSISGTGIYSLQGLDKCTKITTLTLDNTNISNLNIAATLYKLTDLSLANSPITNLDLVICKLSGLKSIYLDNINLDNYDIFNNLAYLTNLAINNSSIAKIPQLNNSTKLESLNLNHNLIDSLDGIENLTTPSYITLENNYIKDLNPLLELGKNKSDKGNPLSLNLSYNLIPTNKEYLDSFTTALKDKINLKYENQKEDMHLQTINDEKYVYTNNSETSYVKSYKLFAYKSNLIEFNKNLNLKTDFDTVMLYDSNLGEFYEVEYRVNENILELLPIANFPNPDHDLYLFIGSDSDTNTCTYVFPITIEEYSPADINKNGTVDIHDLSIVANDYNKQADGSDDWDVHEDCVKDGIIDIYDICYISSQLQE